MTETLTRHERFAGGDAIPTISGSVLSRVTGTLSYGKDIQINGTHPEVTSPNATSPIHGKTARESTGNLQLSNVTNAVDAGVMLIKASMFQEVSDASGGQVIMNSDYACCPMLVGSDSRPVFIYEFVEILDGIVDYDDIKGEFPGLSYAQIGGALSFLRKLSSFNVEGIDIDEIEDDKANDPEFLAALRTAFNDKETKRVLHTD